MSALTASEVINLLGLQPLAGEGGYFRETWRLGASDQPTSTAIYYLITPDSFSSLHRLKYDELFHFYAGDSCTTVMLDTDGNVTSHQLGTNLAEGDLPQLLVPADSWQATKLQPGGRWALLGTTMTPGFQASAFELATSANLQHLTRDVRDQLESYLAV